ncbi:MAG: PKD domain-containing protein, partial [Bacteroidales bacterium]|nr:PKD domain-containing protein [Bacteroidales bacterium]
MKKFFLFLLVCTISLFLGKMLAQPVAGFTVNTTEACAPATIICTNTTTNCTGTITHYWSIIGSPDVSSNEDATFYFASGGNYTIILQETCAEGTDTYEIDITVFDSPTANFDNTVMTGCIPYTANFTDLSVAGDGNITDWTWYFNDGFTSTDQSPEHIYNSGGIYNISLLIEDENGCTSEKTVNNLVRIANDPVVSFLADMPTMCIAPHTVNFTSTVTTSFGLNATYAWNFGDGSPLSDLPNPSHQYSSGVFDVTLTVTDEYGCQTTIVMDDYIRVTTTVPEYSVLEGDVVCRGAQTHFVNETGYACFWDFGDGGTSTQNTPVHVYNTTGVVTVTFIVDYPSGPCLAQTTFDLTVETVTASFTTSPTNLFSCTTPFTVNFTNTSSSNATDFFYVFQDGGSSTDEDPLHTYNESGIFQPTLTVTSEAGCMHTFLGPVINIATPSASFIGDTIEGCSPLTVDFTYNGGSTIDTYSWNFGNGQTNPDGTA